MSAFHRWRWVLILVLVALALGWAVIGILLLADDDDGHPFAGNELPSALEGKKAADFDLRSARGGRLNSRDLAGTPYALTFLFTDCPDICPVIGAELREALQRLGGRAREVAIVAVSIEPRGDTPAAVREWLRVHRLPANFHYLIGPAKSLKPTWDAYYAARERRSRGGGPHTASIWMIDAEGRIRTKFSAGAPVDPGDIAHDFRVLLREG